MSQPRSRILIGLCLVVAATLVGGALGEKLPAGADRDTPSLDEYADILTTLSDWAPEPSRPTRSSTPRSTGCSPAWTPTRPFSSPTSTRP